MANKLPTVHFRDTSIKGSSNLQKLSHSQSQPSCADSPSLTPTTINAFSFQLLSTKEISAN